MRFAPTHLNLDDYFSNFVRQRVERKCPKCGFRYALAVYKTIGRDRPFLVVCLDPHCGYIFFEDDTSQITAIGERIQNDLNANVYKQIRQDISHDPDSAKAWKLGVDTLKGIEPFVSQEYAAPVKLTSSILKLAYQCDPETIGSIAVNAKTLADSLRNNDFGKQPFFAPNKFEAGLFGSINTALGSSGLPAISSAANFNSAFMAMGKALEATGSSGTDILVPGIGVAQSLWNGDFEVVLATYIVSLVFASLGGPMSPMIFGGIHSLAKWLFTESRKQVQEEEEAQSVVESPEISQDEESSLCPDTEEEDLRSKYFPFQTKRVPPILQTQQTRARSQNSLSPELKSIYGEPPSISGNKAPFFYPNREKGLVIPQTEQLSARYQNGWSPELESTYQPAHPISAIAPSQTHQSYYNRGVQRVRQ